MDWVLLNRAVFCFALLMAIATRVWSSETFSVDAYGNTTISGNLNMGSLLMCTKPNSYLWVAGNRPASSVDADIYLSPSVIRDAGNIVAFMNGLQVASVSKDGQISAGVVGNGLNAPASFVDNTGSSGHVALTSAEGMYTTITGKQGQYLVDGVYPYAGLHGEITLGPKYDRAAGWLLQVLNGNQGAPTKFYVDYNGGFGSMAGLSLSQFGDAGLTTTITSMGQFFYGQAESTLMYAADRHHWYVASESTWKRIPFAGDATEYDAADCSSTAGSQTINKLKGKAKFAAGASSLTITNSHVNANSHVSVVLQSNDVTAALKSVVPVSGGFVVNIAAGTADVVFSFVVEN
jgi:hypothetical protein